MPYIGRSTDGFGVRNRFLYLASADDTSVSGADANGATLTFTDGAYVDVYLNGVLLKAGTDYNTNTANTIASLAAMAANDEVTVVVYDVFTVGDMVSATSGGTFVGNVTHSGTVTFGSTVSGLDVNGTEIILDADGDTTITADTDDQIDIKIAGADDFQFTANTFTAQSGSTIAAQALTATTINASGDITGTLATAAQTNITSVGTLTNFRSTGIDDNADALTITIDSSERVGISTSSPSAQLHIDESASNSYATIRLEGNNRGGQIDMYQGSTIVSQIYTDQSGNIIFGSSGGYGQSAIDSTAYMAAENKAFGLRTSTFLTTMADDSTKNIVTNGSGLIIISSYTYGRVAVYKHDYIGGTTLITGDTLYYKTSNTDGKYSLESGSNSFTATLRNRFGGNADFKVMFIGTYQ